MQSVGDNTVISCDKSVKITNLLLSVGDILQSSSTKLTDLKQKFRIFSDTHFLLNRNIVRIASNRLSQVLYCKWMSRREVVVISTDSLRV